jgi:hypothetical protein
MITEIVNDLEELEIGDVVIYASGAGMRSAKIDRKPKKRDPESNWYKATRCKVNLTINTYPEKSWQKGAYVETGRFRIFKTQNFNLEEFNGVKYIQLSVPLFKVIDL